MEDDQEKELMKRAKWEGEGVSGDEQAERENWSHGKRQAAVLMKEDHAAASVKVMTMMMTMTTMMLAVQRLYALLYNHLFACGNMYSFFGSNDFGVTLLRPCLLSIFSFLVLLMRFLELLQAGMVRRDKVGVEREREKEEAANKAENERQHEMLERRKADEAREVAMEEVRSRSSLNPVSDMRMYTI